MQRPSAFVAYATRIILLLGVFVCLPYLTFQMPPAAAASTSVASHVFEGDLVIDASTGSKRAVNALLAGITHVQGDVILRNYERKKQPQGLLNIVHIGGELRVEANDRLVKLSFPALKSVAGGIQILSNPRLRSVDAFESLAICRRVEISHNEKLTDVGDFPHVEELPRGLRIAQNERLVRAPGFPELTEAFDLSWSVNRRLRSIPGFPKLRGVRDAIAFTANISLTEIPAFPELTRLKKLEIISHPLLVRIGDFSKLREGRTEFELKRNPRLSESPWLPKSGAVAATP